MTSNIPTSNSTTSLESNANTISSTVPLNPRQTPQKDYAAAFGALQSRYGVVSSHLPPPTTVVNQKKAHDTPQISTGQTSCEIDSEAWIGSGGNSTPVSDSPSAATGKEFKKKRSFLPWRGLFILWRIDVKDLLRFVASTGQSSLGISGSTGEGAYSSTPPSASESGSKESEGAKKKRFTIPWNSAGG